ncbi:DUF72 domain-containing protein [Sphingomonas sp. JC676]|uniref:DUF72 domain-containing protein n=1 Tax=Sphingomonas sp. JC676 TaxID=2768065 RepID=UPI0016578D3E|nr:DUF72 domain-containing protein [Sphingomonas sp. JC676]MBC9033907.1 DUF72 domain-containing protein [Sphingomonas sp. JC676]
MEGTVTDAAETTDPNTTLGQGPLTRSSIYARFHGAEGKYFGRYSPAVLEDWGDWLSAHASSEQPVWAYFNNDIDGAAIADALALRTVVQ